MSGSFADTNVVIYSVSDDDVKKRIALQILASRPVISTQVLNETAHTLRRKFKFSIVDVRAVIGRLIHECRVQCFTELTIMLALDMADRYGFSHYDSLIVATALEAGCNSLYSEDLQHGQTINGCLIVINPFKAA